MIRASTPAKPGKANKVFKGQQLVASTRVPTSSANPAAPPAVRHVRIGSAAAGQRVDNFLLAELKGVPRSLVYRLLRRGEVRVNKGRAKPQQRLAFGDDVRIPPVRTARTVQPGKPPVGLTERLMEGVLFEDERVLVLDKPAGVAVHGGSGISHGVIEALRAGRGEPELELVHRLDRDTSGCLLLAKRRSALRWLHAQLRENRVRKRYRALLCGSLAERVQRVELPLRKFQLQGGERMVRVDHAEGKPALTVFRRAAAYGGLTLVDVELHTGRTHQIRVHAAGIGAPVAGDDKYGRPEDRSLARALSLSRLFLHASELTFSPREGAEAVAVSAPLPEALADVVRRAEAHGLGGGL
jgi:23S rRNA pseudouridine955/2504/2580 synthase